MYNFYINYQMPLKDYYIYLPYLHYRIHIFPGSLALKHLPCIKK
jgi:hypothetical protein